MAFTGGWADILIVYRLSQIPENSGWDVNGKSFFGSSHWKIPGTNGNSEKVVPFSRLGRSKWKFLSHVVTRIQSSAARQSGNFRQMVNDTYRSCRPKIPNQNFRSFFINGKKTNFSLFSLASNRWMNEWMSEWMNEWMNEWTNEWEKQLVCRWCLSKSNWWHCYDRLQSKDNQKLSHWVIYIRL